MSMATRRDSLIMAAITGSRNSRDIMSGSLALRRHGETDVAADAAGQTVAEIFNARAQAVLLG